MHYNLRMTTSENTSRAQWMRTRGKEIYGEWTSEILAAEDVPRYWSTFLVGALPLSHYRAGNYPIQALGLALTSRSSDLMTVDSWKGTSARHLYPNLDELMTYTSAGNFNERQTFVGPVRSNPEDAVVSHAYDSLEFAVSFTVGAANDIYLARTGNKPQQAALAYYNSTTGREHLAQLRGILQDQVFIEGLHTVAGTGFDVLGVEASLIEHAYEEYDDDLPQEGWKLRAMRCGLFTDKAEARAGTTVKPIFELGPSGEIMGLRPTVPLYLHRKLQEQNSAGLDEIAQTRAGGINAFKSAISSGCPLRNTPAIGNVAQFAAKACTAILEYPDEIRV